MATSSVRDGRVIGEPWSTGKTEMVEDLAADRETDKSSVAQLAVSKIGGMSRVELVDVIERSDLPLLKGPIRRRLVYLDRGSLERLAHLARRCCHNQGY